MLEPGSPSSDVYQCEVRHDQCISPSRPMLPLLRSNTFESPPRSSGPYFFETLNKFNRKKISNKLSPRNPARKEDNQNEHGKRSLQNSLPDFISRIMAGRFLLGYCSAVRRIYRYRDKIEDRDMDAISSTTLEN